MKIFIYEWLDMTNLSFENFQLQLANYGKEGWELCGFNYGYAIFKFETSDQKS